MITDIRSGKGVIKMTKAMAEKLARKAEKLARGHGGDLPNPCLKESGYSGLVAIMGKHPRRFAHS